MELTILSIALAAVAFYQAARNYQKGAKIQCLEKELKEKNERLERAMYFRNGKGQLQKI